MSRPFIPLPALSLDNLIFCKRVNGGTETGEQAGRQQKKKVKADHFGHLSLSHKLINDFRLLVAFYLFIDVNKFSDRIIWRESSLFEYSVCVAGEVYY